MTTQTMITLNQIRKHDPCDEMWSKVLKANGGTEADLDREFPVSSVLDSNGLKDTLWILRCLPEYESMWRKFSWWSALSAARAAARAAAESAAESAESAARAAALSAAESAESAARAAALSAAESAAWSAARAAARAAALSAAESAESAARAAALSAAESAAESARLAQEARLRNMLDTSEWREDL